MRSISDLIEDFLIDTMGDDERLNISRNELANFFSCAPSQINYVLSTRFTPERGYIIESRRGGGGSVTVVKLSKRPDEIYDDFIAEALSEGVSYVKAVQIIDRITEDAVLSVREAEILKTAISDKSLVAPATVKDKLRGNILKNVLTKLIHLSAEQ